MRKSTFPLWLLLELWKEWRIPDLGQNYTKIGKKILKSLKKPGLTSTSRHLFFKQVPCNHRTHSTGHRTNRKIFVPLCWSHSCQVCSFLGEVQSKQSWKRNPWHQLEKLCCWIQHSKSLKFLLIKIYVKLNYFLIRVPYHILIYRSLNFPVQFYYGFHITSAIYCLTNLSLAAVWSRAISFSFPYDTVR